MEKTVDIKRQVKEENEAVEVLSNEVKTLRETTEGLLLRLDQIEKSKTKKNSFNCKFCTKIFAKQGSLNTHITKVHNDGIPQVDGGNKGEIDYFLMLGYPF